MGNLYAKQMKNYIMLYVRQAANFPSVLFQQDNAPTEKSRVVMAPIKYAGFELIEHLPYSPDLSCSDFYLFPRLRCQKFKDDDTVIGTIQF